MRDEVMSKLAFMVTLALTLATAAKAQTAIPDMRGTWKGNSETIILGSGNPHHEAPSAAAPRLNSVPFTLTVDKQDDRRFSGTFASPRSTEPIIAVISHTGTIFLVDDDGYTVGTMLAPDRMELCYMMLSPATRIASCTVLAKQP
jgi:hypothetical protein